jgi:hypothetical protein
MEKMIMKICDETVEILRNFSTINPSIAVSEGSVLRTISEQKNILAQATVTESFPRDFAVYELNTLLGFISLFEDPDVIFNESYLAISGDNSRTGHFIYTDANMITTPPVKNIDVADAEVNFELSANDYKDVVKAAHQLQLPEIVVESDNGGINLIATDVKNTTSNVFSCQVGTTNNTFKMIFRTENLRFLDGDYDVNISSKGVGHFKNTSCELEYWVATEGGSSYDS